MAANFSGALKVGQQQSAKHLALAGCYAGPMVTLTSKDIRRANLQLAVNHWLASGRRQKEVALRLGISESYLTQMLSGHRNIGDHSARTIERNLGLGLGAIDQPWESWDAVNPTPGQGKHISETQEERGIYAVVPVVSSNGEDRGAEVNIPFFPSIRAAAGQGIFNGQTGEPLHLKFREVSLRRRGIDIDSAMVIYADGDSMDPLIGDGDTIMFDRSKTDITDGKLYVIEVDDEALVKRLHKRPGGRVLVQSENPAYPAYEVTLQSPGFRILGKVVWGAGWLD